MNANNEMKWTLKVGWTKTKALFWHLSGGTEESHEPHSPNQDSQPQGQNPQTS